jgi:hypothetical protein
MLTGLTSESYGAAEKHLRERAKGTIFDLVRRFEASPQFPKADSTRAEYRRKFKIIERQWGAAPIAALFPIAGIADRRHHRGTEEKSSHPPANGFSRVKQGLPLYSAQHSTFVAGTGGRGRHRTDLIAF